MAFKSRMQIDPPVYRIPQVNSIDSKLRSNLERKIYLIYPQVEKVSQSSPNEITPLRISVWENVFDKPYDELFDYDEYSPEEFYIAKIQPIILHGSYDNVYELIELTLSTSKKLEYFDEIFSEEEISRSDSYIQKINIILDKYWSGYRLNKNGEVIPASSLFEQETIEWALLLTQEKDFLEDTHNELKRALSFLVEDPQPRSAVESAITAMEHLVLHYAPTSKQGGFDKAIAEIRKKSIFPSALIKALHWYWQYSNAKHIRHANKFQPHVSIWEARRDVIVLCALIAYTIEFKELGMHEH